MQAAIGTIIIPQYIKSNPQTPWICQVIWQNEVKVADGMKVINQLTLNRKGIQASTHYLDGCNVIPKVLKSGNRQQKRRLGWRRDYRKIIRDKQHWFLGFRWNKGVTEECGFSRSWKLKEIDSLSELPERNAFSIVRPL